MTTIWGRTMAGLRAFREAFMSSADEIKFSEFEARQARYAVLWAFFESNAYSAIHSWSVRHKSEYGVYKYARNIYNPAYRLASFYRSHIFGGALDPNAGDGKAAPSAFPVVTDNEALRPALARLWRDSNWQVNKGIVPQMGAALGDVALRVVDDTERARVYLKHIHPATLKSVSLDPFGNVKGYEIEDTIPDPRRKGTPVAIVPTVTYTERATRNGDNVVFETFLDGKSFAYDDSGESKWEEPYGFVPMVVIKHNDIGQQWGWAEIHPNLSKAREVDDIASKTDDQIRKMVDSPWLFSGVKSQGELKTASSATTGMDGLPSQQGRQDIPSLYGPPEARATPLVAPLDLASALTAVKGIIEELEREYPELQMDIWSASGDTSGRALRVARQRVEAKVIERRSNYDNAAVRAMQMAVAIGGFRGYEGYAGFGLESYAAGTLDFSIAERPVFPADIQDKIDAATAKKALGVPVETLWGEIGYSEEQIAQMKSEPSFVARQSMTATGLNARGG